MVTQARLLSYKGSSDDEREGNNEKVPVHTPLLLLLVVVVVVVPKIAKMSEYSNFQTAPRSRLFAQSVGS